MAGSAPLFIGVGRAGSEPLAKPQLMGDDEDGMWRWNSREDWDGRFRRSTASPERKAHEAPKCVSVACPKAIPSMPTSTKSRQTAVGILSWPNRWCYCVRFSCRVHECAGLGLQQENVTDIRGRATCEASRRAVAGRRSLRAQQRVEGGCKQMQHLKLF